jgi:hypothetical protein
MIPLGTDLDKVDATPARLQPELDWNDDAKTEFDRLVDAHPVLVRISAAKRLRDAAERDARCWILRGFSRRALDPASVRVQPDAPDDLFLRMTSYRFPEFRLAAARSILKEPCPRVSRPAVAPAAA